MKKLLLLLSLVSVITFSCNKTEEPAPDVNKLTIADVNNIAGDYTFEGYAVSKTAGSDKVSLSIKKLTDGKLEFTGRSYVNQYGGSYYFDEEGGSITFKELMTTEMAALDHSQNLAEQEYYNNFQKVRKFRLEGNILKFFDSEPASEIMIFKKK